MKTSQLHLAPDRRERFAALASKAWLETALLRTWVIAEPVVDLCIEVEEKTKRELRVEDIFENPTVDQLAAHLAAQSII